MSTMHPSSRNAFIFSLKTANERLVEVVGYVGCLNQLPNTPLIWDVVLYDSAVTYVGVCGVRLLACCLAALFFQYLKMKVEVSERKHKKYVAILDDGRRIHFGDKRYQHFRDSTPLKRYSHLDHGDVNRRDSFHARFKHSPKNSAGYFALKYLW